MIKMPNGFILGNKHIYRSVLMGVYCIPVPAISTQRKNKTVFFSVTLTLASMGVILFCSPEPKAQCALL